MKKIQKPELLAPAGDLEKLKIAFMYGADAVYCSMPDFAMRSREIGFDEKSLKEGILYARKLNKKVYITLNTFIHPCQITDFKKHVKKMIQLKPDAFIVSDPGVIDYLKNCPIPLHLSTQASTTNQLAVNFWAKNNISRVVLARELSLREIKTISKTAKIEIETFVHGAMCMAYSGRCQISNYLTSRDPNQGKCVQACRFKYKLYNLEEEQRKDEFFPVFEDDSGSYIFNSKDLCMIKYIPELINAGIDSFKIEGRIKGIYYLAVVIRAYRKAIDLYFYDRKMYNKNRDKFFAEICKTSSRGFTTGFYFNKPDSNTNNYLTQREKGDYSFVGVVKKYDKNTKTATVLVMNKLVKNSLLEIITPEEILKHKLTSMKVKNKKTDIAHANWIIEFKTKNILNPNYLIRTKRNEI